MASVAAWDAPRPQCPLRVRALLAVLILFLPGLTSTLYAQTSSPPLQASARPAARSGAAPEASEVSLLVGRSTVLDVPGPISRVSLTSPDVADAMVTTPSQVLIHGKTVGTISMFVWDRGGGIRRYEVVVHRDMSQLESQMHELFPGEPIAVAGNGKNVVISGTVSSKYVLDKAAEIAAGYVEKKENVVNLLQQVEGVASTQVLLRVRFAEVSRTALSELGASFFSENYKNKFARTTTEQFPAPFFDQQNPILSETLVFSDYLNLFLFDSKNQLGTVIRALSTRGLFESLAEPNLIAQNGQEASFLAGGEYPYPVVQGAAAGLSVTIQFKEFGIKLNFTPTVLGGDLIHLKVRPEVSSLDFTNAVSLQGFRIPALSTRRAETELELRDGQTFAIAGLLNNTMTSTMQKIPGIGDIPILGLLFKSRAARKEQTELVVMITPQIMRPGAPGAATDLPRLIDPFLGRPSPSNTTPMPPPYGGQGSPRGSVTPTPQNNPRVSAPAASSSRPAATPTTAPSVAPAPATPANAVAPPPAPKPTRQEREAMERAKREEQKRLQAEAAVREAEQKRAAEQAKLDAQRAAEEQKRAAAQAKVDAERAAEEQKRAAAQAKVDAERAAEEQKRAAAQAKIDAARAAEAAKKQQELAREQAKQQAEADRRAAEARKRQEDAERKRGAALAEAEARLKAAQAAYQEQLKRSSTQTQQ